MDDWRPRMRATVRLLGDQLGAFRAGRVGPDYVAAVRVAGRGALKGLAAVMAREGRIVVRPFQPGDVPAVLRALEEARLSAYALDPKTVAVTVPPISVEARADMVRQVRRLGHDAKIAVRAVRQDARKQIARLGRGSERAVQEATDAAVAEIDRLVEAKARELGD